MDRRTTGCQPVEVLLLTPRQADSLSYTTKVNNGAIMPNPKRRHSKARRDKRRAHDALRVPQTNLCPNCREPRMPHRVCPKCGYYKGREVIQVEQT